VHRESIDMSKAWMQSRYDKTGPGGTGSDYINCAMNKEQYENFVRELIASPKTDFPGMGKEHAILRRPCLPIEVMAERASHAALVADEAGWPHQSAHPASRSLLSPEALA